jgi:hypothetical protein
MAYTTTPDAQVCACKTHSETHIGEPMPHDQSYYTRAQVVILNRPSEPQPVHTIHPWNKSPASIHHYHTQVVPCKAPAPHIALQSELKHVVTMSV